MHNTPEARDPFAESPLEFMQGGAQVRIHNPNALYETALDKHFTVLSKAYRDGPVQNARMTLGPLAQEPPDLLNMPIACTATLQLSSPRDRDAFFFKLAMLDQTDTAKDNDQPLAYAQTGKDGQYMVTDTLTGTNMLVAAEGDNAVVMTNNPLVAKMDIAQPGLLSRSQRLQGFARILVGTHLNIGLSKTKALFARGKQPTHFTIGRYPLDFSGLYRIELTSLASTDEAHIFGRLNEREGMPEFDNGSAVKFGRPMLHDVVGHTAIKENLMGKVANVYVSRQRPVRVVLHGRGGDGKTLLAHAFANYLDAQVLTVEHPAENEHTLNNLATAIRTANEQVQPTVLLLENVSTQPEQLGRGADPNKDSVQLGLNLRIRQMLALVDCVTNAEALVILTCQQYNRVFDSLTSFRYGIYSPNVDVRKEMFAAAIAGTAAKYGPDAWKAFKFDGKDGIDVTQLARQSASLSCRGITSIIYGLYASRQAAVGSQISQQDIMDAINNLKRL